MGFYFSWRFNGEKYKVGKNELEIWFQTLFRFVLFLWGSINLGLTGLVGNIFIVQMSPLDQVSCQLPNVIHEILTISLVDLTLKDLFKTLSQREGNQVATGSNKEDKQ